MTPFRNKNNFLVSAPSLSDGCLSSIIDASMFCLIRLNKEAARRTFQVNEWIGLFFRCFSGSESFCVSSCSCYLILTFLNSNQFPKRHKRNAIISDFNRATRIASFPADEIPKIKQKFLHADYQYRFINSVINNFQEKSDGTDDYIIPPGFFDVPKKVVLVDIPYCLKNEEFWKPFVKKFDVFTDNKYDIRIKWITKKVKQLFKLKSRNPHPSCVIYEGVCSCQESYISETVRNVEIRWQEHEDTQKVQNLQSIWKIIQFIHLLGKLFSQPRQLDVLDKTWKHQ